MFTCGNTQVALLATGLLLSAVTSTLIANDLHWAQDAAGGVVLMMLVFLLATTICSSTDVVESLRNWQTYKLG